MGRHAFKTTGSATLARHLTSRTWLWRALQLPVDLALLASFLVAVLGLAGAYSSTWDQLNNFAPLWIFGGFLAGACSIALARHLLPRVIMLGVVFVAFAWLVAPEFLHGRASVPAGAPSFKVVEFNVWKENPHMDKVAAWLLAQKADVLILAEATPALRLMLKSAYPYSVSCLGIDRCSTMIYTKVRPIATGGLAKGGDPEQRTALSGTWAKLETHSGPVLILGLHLDHPWPLGRGEDEMTPIRQFLDGQSRERIVVAGDLNRTPWSYMLDRTDKAIGVPRVTRGIPTWPADGWIPTMFPIDHMYVGKGLVAHDVHRGPYTYSDHLPMIAEISPAH